MQNQENSGQNQKSETKNHEERDDFGVLIKPEDRMFASKGPDKRGQNRTKPQTDRTFSAEEGGAEDWDDESPLLPPKQEMALAAILSGKTDKAAAAVAGVTPRTLRRWKSTDSQFRETLERQLLDNRSASTTRLQMLADAAIVAVGKAVFKGDAPMGFRLLRGLGYLPGNQVEIGPTAPAQLTEQLKAEKKFGETLIELLGTQASGGRMA